MLPDFFGMSNRDKNNRPNSGSGQPYGRNLFWALGSQVVKALGLDLRVEALELDFDVQGWLGLPAWWDKLYWTSHIP